MKKVLEKQQIIKSKRQPKTLKKILTRAKVHIQSSDPTVKKCGRANCGICSYLIEGPEFTFKDGQTFKVKENLTCNSENLIYVITCCGCLENYIGQTGMSLRKRMTLHRQQIRDESTRQIPLSGYIEICAGMNLPNSKVFPIYKYSDSTTEQQRINKEKQFIQKYKPRLNI